MAVFILGIGVIGIAAVFPVGIAQQRRSVDDLIGPMVADNAIAILRSKVRQEDFGTFEEFNAGYVAGTVPGDWPWKRPAFFLASPSTSVTLPGSPPTIVGLLPGSIGIFNTTVIAAAAEPSELLSGAIRPSIPWNPSLYDPATFPDGPFFFITQQERYYPQVSQFAAPGLATSKPQYIWDCMFRRFQGKIMVAIFVYRVRMPGGSDIAFTVPPGGTIPPLPVSLDLRIDPDTGDIPPTYCATGRWDSFGLTLESPPGTPSPQDDNIVFGTATGTTFNAQEPQQAWQVPGQWLLDQNVNIHRVLSVSKPNAGDLGQRIELVRPPPAYMQLNGPSAPDVYFYDPFPPTGRLGEENIVTNIWYIPISIEADLNSDGIPETPINLTPVYAVVREL